MYQRILKFWCLVGVSLSVVGAAGAEDFNREVSAGKRTLVGQFALYSMDTCYAGAVPDAKVGKAPANGKLDFTEERVVTKAGNCDAQAISFRRVYYTPKPGFRGQDSVSVDFFYNRYSDAPGLMNRRESYNITVK